MPDGRVLSLQPLDKCVAYFKKNGGFVRLMDGLLDMYIRYERCFGAVRLSNPTPEEERAVSLFFNRDYFNQALIRIGLADFERNLQKKFSAEITLEMLLEAYFDRRVIRRGGSRAGGSAFAVYLNNELIPRLHGTDAGAWLRDVSAHMRRSYRKLSESYNNDPDMVTDKINTVVKALNRISGRDTARTGNRKPAVLLSEFSKKQTGDAYALAADGKYGPLFLMALAWKYGQPAPHTPDECASLYFKAGFLSEGAFSHAAVRGLFAYSGQMPDEVCAIYRKRNEAFILTVENLNRFTRVTAYKNKVFAVENILVFSALCERLSDCPCTLVCVESGLNPAAALLLDMLCGSGAALYYSGDLDYIGLCLADKLYLRYPKNFIPWRLSKQDYENIISDNDFYLNARQKEEGLHNEELAALLSHIRKKGKTAEQRALVEVLAEDVREMCK